MSNYDLVIANGRFFDGRGGVSEVMNLGIKDGLLVEISKQPIRTSAVRTIDASGQWVMPGLIDNHTHYDAEVIASPGLTESVRHGVTTVITGSCSLSTVYSNALDCADLFSRVEALPYEPVLKILSENKTWNDPEGWIAALNNRPLGPNVASMLGHSDLRTGAMGLDRATSRAKPTSEEKETMIEGLNQALDAGFVGMSSMTNTWDKLDGDRYRSRCLPSTYASWREYGWLHNVLRTKDRILQSAPNLNTKVNVLLFFLTSSSRFRSRALKTALISAADPKASEWIVPLFGVVTRFLNRILKSKMTWQAMPCPFEVYADGIDLVVFEEFGSGAEAMHLRDELERNQLLDDEAYRRRFRKDYVAKFSPRIWQRDFHEAEIVDCPESDLVGLSIGQVADARGIHPCDAFLDLVVQHGSAFRWKTLIANHRPEVLGKILQEPTVHVGFADSGAHLRNMGFYNFALHFLRRAKVAEETGQEFMSIERAVHRVTEEPAKWFNLDAGYLALGRRADIAVINPEGLNDDLDAYHEAEMPEMDGVNRMVRRNDLAVSATVIGGRIAFERGTFADDFGESRYGRFLRAGVADRAPIKQVSRPEEPMRAAG